METDARRTLKLELAHAEADYEEAKRRHERSLAAQVRAAGFAESRSGMKGAYIEESIESGDSTQTEHELREARLKLQELRRKLEDLMAEDDPAR